MIANLDTVAIQLYLIGLGQRCDLGKLSKNIIQDRPHYKMRYKIDEMY